MITASQEAKLAGLKSIREAAKLLGVGQGTLFHRFNNNKAFFKASIDKAVELKKQKLKGDL